MSARLLGAAHAAAVAAPLLATALILALTLADWSGVTLFPATAPRNSAESAGMAQPGSLMQYLKAGEDPARIYEIDPEIISSSVLRATALEAAVWSRQVGIIELLDHRGAFGDDGRRRAIRCLADDLRATDIADYLIRQGDPPCVPQAAYDLVLQRTRDLTPP